MTEEGDWVTAQSFHRGHIFHSILLNDCDQDVKSNVSNLAHISQPSFNPVGLRKFEPNQFLFLPLYS